MVFPGFHNLKRHHELQRPGHTLGYIRRSFEGYIPGLVEWLGVPASGALLAPTAVLLPTANSPASAPIWAGAIDVPSSKLP